MTKYFEIFDKRLKLTSKQLQDAKTKYNNVCKTLHKHYYKSKYDGKTKLLFGSYRKNTNIRPITKMQDVDVLFKIPKDVFDRFDNYSGNGQSALLQEIRNILNRTFTTTEKISAWGKVVLVKTTDGTHNIELLPAYELSDGRFKIPNSENGGSWEIFDPRRDIEELNQSNNKTNGLTKKVIRILKSWKRQNKTLYLKSFEIEQLVIKYFNKHESENLGIELFLKIFNFFRNKINNENKSFINTAINRLKNAKEYKDKEKFDEVCKILKNIFGDLFLSYKKEIRAIYESAGYEIAPGEMFIEDMFEMDIDNNSFIKINCKIEMNGFQITKLQNFLNKFGLLPKKYKLEFYIEKTNIEKPYNVYWKVRNFGNESKLNNDLRGKIIKSKDSKIEYTKYKATHYVECYIVKSNKCVAIDRINVPIGDKYGI